MIKFVSKKEEYELFDRLSNDWWNENGKFKVLHQIRNLRISYILKQILVVLKHHNRIYIKKIFINIIIL